MDDARALLDSLMGPSRNKKKVEGESEEGFLEKNVCRRYLAGCCPNDLFKSTKREMEVCPKIHSDSLKEELKAHPKSAKYTAEFEEECIRYLEGIKSEADRWVKREQGNLRGERKEFQPTAGQTRSLQDLGQRYKDAMAECSAAEEAGDLQKGKVTMAAALQIAEDLKDLKEKCHVEMGAEIVCELCGVRYPTGEGERERGHRDAHLFGKLHEAYGLIRDHIEELKKRKRENEEAKEKERGEKKEKEKGDDDKGRKRSRSRDKGRRDRSKSRGKRDRDRSRDRRRSRSRDRRRR